ncbi:unnamed protein product [Blepharisma stoltei]|uniref:Endonuclease/exonuclease/phosphatase domain-containing protein n=1 Tax=Blepharisma stoltei TaxID=1481888 RepID=A0AAU9JW41_9CILI|nr:unnamed protein product [Blepharisma stoltei]
MDDICLPNISRKSAKLSQNSSVVTDGAYTIKTASKRVSVTQKNEAPPQDPETTQNLSELWINSESKPSEHKRSIQNSIKPIDNRPKILNYDISSIIPPEEHYSRNYAIQEAKARFIFESIYSESPDIIAFQHIQDGFDQYSLIQGYQSIYKNWDEDGCMISWKANKYDLIQRFHHSDAGIFGIIGLLREKFVWTEYILFACFQCFESQGLDIADKFYESTLRAAGNSLNKSEYKNIKIIIAGNFGIVMDKADAIY